MKIRSKRWISLILAAMFVIGLFGCSSSGDPSQIDTSSSIAASTSNMETSTEVSAEQSDRPSVLRTMIFSEPVTFDIFQVSGDGEIRGIMENIYAGLVSYDEDGVISCKDGIAESYSISDDGLVYTFQLKDNVIFHDGRPCTVEDVKYTYSRRAGLTGDAANANYACIQEINTPDDKTVEIVLKYANAGFLSWLTFGVAPNDPDYVHNTHPLGCGPYKFVEYIAGKKVILEAFDGYVGDTKPQIQRLELNVMGDSNSVVLALRSGDLDFAQIFASDIPALENDFTIVESSKNTVEWMALNNQKAPFDDVRVRRAVSMAINKQEVIDMALYGAATEVPSILTPALGYYYNPDLMPLPYDPEGAKELLKEAGYDEGELTFTLLATATFPEDVNCAVAIADQLARIGVNCVIEKVEWPTFNDVVFTKKEYQAGCIGMPGGLDPTARLGPQITTGNSSNWMGFANEHFDKIVMEAYELTDPAARKVLYDEAQQILIDEASTIYLMDTTRIVAAAPYVKGYKPYPTYCLHFANLYYEG